MACMPIEVSLLDGVPGADLAKAIALANGLQAEFRFSQLTPEESGPLRLHSYRQARAAALLDVCASFRGKLPGYHPFLIAVTDSRLEGKALTNLFGSHDAERGVAIVTIADVSDVVLPSSKMAAYYAYYLARYTLSFVAPQKKSHDDTKQCVFDRKIWKRDILKSMRPRALCDDCRTELILDDRMSPTQSAALDMIFAAAGDLMNSDGATKKPRVFVGSSRAVSRRV